MKKLAGVFDRSGQTVPAFENYVAQNPILMFKDRWNRLVAVAESDYLGQKGGAKPVVYFYPEIETDIQLKFDTPMQLDVQIPKYNEQTGWKVKAKPNGELQDLQPKITNCDDFKKPKIGQEYALKSCLENNYPYIYWAGASLVRSFPREISQKGWIVKRENLEKVLTEKLTFIGLNARETTNFMEYWLPKLKAENKPFYRLTFLQNAELNDLFPMTITPRPSSLIRVFLDWETLENDQIIPSQNLIKYERNDKQNSFLAVKWGGLKFNPKK